MRQDDTHEKKHCKEFFLKYFWMAQKVNKKRHKDGNFQRHEHLSRRNKEIPSWVVQLNHLRARVARRLVVSDMQRMPPFPGGFVYGEDENIFKNVHKTNICMSKYMRTSRNRHERNFTTQEASPKGIN